MRRTIGVAVAENIATGAVENGKLVGALNVFPSQNSGPEELLRLPAEAIAQQISRQILAAAAGQTVDTVGAAFPGIIGAGVIQESPNLQQLKGSPMVDLIGAHLREAGIAAPVFLYNDADAMAAGLAASRDQLDRNIRVWSLGNGIGFGVYPHAPGVWEAGHMVISLDATEKFCGCGGRGHLEGVMGYRAMRLRFMDLEPEEVFEQAANGDQRCSDFVKFWHKALAAATANSIHMAGPGKFLITGYHAKHVDVRLLDSYLHEMVKMSPLGTYTVEVVPGGPDLAVVGAAVNADQAAFPG
jgi:glucokinase